MKKPWKPSWRLTKEKEPYRRIYPRHIRFALNLPENVPDRLSVSTDSSLITLSPPSIHSYKSPSPRTKKRMRSPKPLSEQHLNASQLAEEVNNLADDVMELMDEVEGTSMVEWGEDLPDERVPSEARVGEWLQDVHPGATRAHPSPEGGPHPCYVPECEEAVYTACPTCDRNVCERHAGDHGCGEVCPVEGCGGVPFVDCPQCEKPVCKEHLLDHDCPNMPQVPGHLQASWELCHVEGCEFESVDNCLDCGKPVCAKDVFDHNCQGICQYKECGEEVFIDCPHCRMPICEEHLLDHDCPNQPDPEELFDDESPGLLSKGHLDEAFSPKEIPTDQLAAEMEDYAKKYEEQQRKEFEAELERDIIGDEELEAGAIQGEPMTAGEMGIALQNLVDQKFEREFMAPQEILEGAFSPEILHDNQLRAMLQPSPDPLLAPEAVQGLRMMRCEPSHRTEQIIAQHGYGRGREEERERQWNERVERWRKEAQDREAQQRDAEAVFGVRSRALSAPALSPAQPPYQPETIPWGESPLSHISPSPETTRASRSDDRLPRLKLGYKDPVKPRSPEGVPATSPDCEPLIPSWVIAETVNKKRYQESLKRYKGLASTSTCYYNFGKGRYEVLDDWGCKNLRVPEEWRGDREWLDREFAKRKVWRRPGPGVVPPRPATPPPPPGPEHGPEPEERCVYIPTEVWESPETVRRTLGESLTRFEQKFREYRERRPPWWESKQLKPWVAHEYTGRGGSRRRREVEKEKRTEDKARDKFEAYLLGKYGSVPYFDRRGRIRGIPKTASTFRPRAEEPPPPKKKAPAIKPYDEPLYGPWYPWVYGSFRPPPKQSVKIDAPYTPSPPPVVLRPRSREPTPSTPGPSTPRVCPPRTQPAQVQYGSARAPPKTASSYKYSETPTGRPASAGTSQDRRRRRPIQPSTPEMLFGSRRVPPKTAACPKGPQLPPCYNGEHFEDTQWTSKIIREDRKIDTSKRLKCPNDL